MFKDCLKESKVSPGRRSPGGRSFNSRGPAAEKLLSPSLLCVRGMSSFRLSLKNDEKNVQTTAKDQHAHRCKQPIGLKTMSYTTPQQYHAQLRHCYISQQRCQHLQTACLQFHRGFWHSAPIQQIRYNLTFHCGCISKFRLTCSAKINNKRH